MGTITINIKDDVERRFRETVKNVKGTGKGKLGQALTEAIDNWTTDLKQKKIKQDIIALMEKGFDMGKIKIRSRAELYER